jgi:hypothetical protein
MDLKNAFPRTYNKLTSSEHNHLLAEEITQEKWSYLNSFIYLIQIPKKYCICLRLTGEFSTQVMQGTEIHNDLDFSNKFILELKDRTMTFLNGVLVE